MEAHAYSLRINFLLLAYASRDLQEQIVSYLLIIVQIILVYSIQLVLVDQMDSFVPVRQGILVLHVQLCQIHVLQILVFLVLLVNIHLFSGLFIYAYVLHFC